MRLLASTPRLLPGEGLGKQACLGERNVPRLLVRDLGEEIQAVPGGFGQGHIGCPSARAISWIGNRRRFGASNTTSTRRPCKVREMRVANRADRAAGFSTAWGSSTNKSRSPPDRLVPQPGAEDPQGGRRPGGISSDAADGLDLVFGQAHYSVQSDAGRGSG